VAQFEVIATAAVPLPPERAWELLCDTERYPDWVSGTDAVTRTDGPASPGSTYDEVNPVAGPWKASSRWTVTEFDAPRRQVHRGEGIPLAKRFEVVMEVRPVEGASEVTMALRGEPALGPVGGAFAALQKPRLQRDVARSVERFAERAATAAAAEPGGAAG
jgi:carbon monoxide dehydrogenase subunit G